MTLSNTVTTPGMSFGEKQGVILCSNEYQHIHNFRSLLTVYYELYYYHDEYFWQKLPSRTSYSDSLTVLSIPEEMAKCESITSPTTSSSTATPSTDPYVTLNTTPTITTNDPPSFLYLEIGIPVAIASVIVMTLSIYFLCFYHKRKHSNNEEFVLQNIFNLRNPPKFDHLSQKMFDDEIAMLEQVDGQQITKGNQIGKYMTSRYTFFVKSQH